MKAQPRSHMRHLLGVLGTLIVVAALCTAAPVAADGPAACVGDCDGNQQVTIDDLLIMVNVALDNRPASACANGDPSADGAITIDEVLQAVNNALSACPAEPTVTPTSEEPTVFFSSDPQAARNPFPSDRLLDASGHVRVPVSVLDPGVPETAAYQATHTYLNNLAAQMHAFTGFATYAPIRIPVGAPVAIDPSDNPPGIMLLNVGDLDAAPPPIRVSYYQPDGALEIQPVLPLKPRTTYAIVVTTAVQDTHGQALQPSADFTAWLAGTGPELDAWRVRLDPVIAHLGAHGVGVSDLALLDLFTTQAITDDLLAIRDLLDAGSVAPGAPHFDASQIPGVTTGIFDAGTAPYVDVVKASTSPNIAKVAIGTFESNDFRTGPDGPFDPDVVSGAAAPTRTALDFYMTIPKTAPPPGGYPIVIFAHGLYGSNRDIVNVPQAIGDAPLMGIGISAIHNGLRGEPGTFFVFDNATATREYLRQTVADLLQLKRMITRAHAAMTPPFDQIDPDHVVYYGGSLGGILGTMFMALEPDVQTAMLNVPGGGLATALSSSYLMGITNPRLAQQTGIAQNDALYPLMVHRLRQVMQWAWDAGDPINYAPYVVVPGAQLPGVPPKRILMHEGIVDTIMPNANTEALAAAMQLADVKATRGCNDAAGCSGIWRYVMTDYHKIPTAGHAVTGLVSQALTQAGQYLSSFGTVVTDASP